MKKFLLLMLFLPCLTYGQITQYVNFFDYKNINTQTFIPMQGWNTEQKYILSILKHSFELQHIVGQPRDTIFLWNGLIGEKTIYSKDSLVLFILRPADTIKRPCVLLTHGNNAKYRSSWNEYMNFYTIDLAMRGYCVAYYENPSSFEAKQISAHIGGNYNQLLAHPRNAFYNGFQSSVAADNFIKHNAAFLNIDTTKIFAGGYSFGAFCSLMLATSDAGINFTDTLFSMQGNFSAKSNYNIYTKNIQRVFAIGGGLPKEDTVSLNSSHMGKFLEEQDAGLGMMFLHGRTDNFVSFDLTKFAESDTSTDYFFGEGPRALLNQVQKNNLDNPSKLFVNCRSGHSFLTQVCGYSNPYCLPQFQWLYLPEPMGDLSSNNSYYSDSLNDTLLHYFAYMMTQVNDVGFLIGDFFQPSLTGDPSTFADGTYYIEPRDSFTYANSSGHYVVKNTDCEGHSLVITAVHQQTHDHSVRIYPNPSNDFIMMEGIADAERIAVYSSIGNLVKEIFPSSNSFQMNIQDLSAGEYICTIQSNQKTEIKKFIVLR